MYVSFLFSPLNSAEILVQHLELSDLNKRAQLKEAIQMTYPNVGSIEAFDSICSEYLDSLSVEDRLDVESCFAIASHHRTFLVPFAPVLSVLRFKVCDSLREMSELLVSSVWQIGQGFVCKGLGVVLVDNALNLWEVILEGRVVYEFAPFTLNSPPPEVQVPRIERMFMSFWRDRS